jgi:hypothetical protein
MAKRLQLRGGTTSQHSTFTGALREVTVDTDKDTLVVHDGATAGGIPLAKYSDVSSINTDLVNDTTPQLGGDLDLNSSDITGTGNVNVTGTVTATSFSGDGSGLSGVTSVGGATGVDFNDNVKARFGTGNDLEIYHDGSNSYIKETGTGNLGIQSNGTEIQISKTPFEHMIRAIPDGAVKLYYDNSEKLETTTDGVSVTGHVEPSATDTYDLGQSDKVWRNIYTGDLHLSNEAKSEGNSVDGTKGNWTIQEGSEDLFIVNNKSGKKYKFKLEEI